MKPEEYTMLKELAEGMSLVEIQECQELFAALEIITKITKTKETF